MPLPEFTAQEKFLISSIKTHVGQANHYMWGYMIPGMLLCGFGLYYQATPLAAAALVVICGFRLYEERYTQKWLPQWRTIIEKYEAAANGQVAASGSKGE